MEPLRGCQRSSGAVLDPGEVEPAPLPGYALAPFALLSHLSFSRAAAVLSISAAAATLLAALLLAQLTELPAGLILLLFMPLALLNIAYSELPVFSMAALVVVGWALRTQRWWLAGIAAAATLLQPQVAAPVILSLFVLAPRTRIPLICSLLALCAISIAAIGYANNVEYFRYALPAQALSELVAADQYSVSHHLYVSGLPAKVAIVLAEAWTAIMAIAGLIAAYYAGKRFAAPEMTAFLPAAAVMLGGLYLHDVQFIAAIPAALVTFVHVEPKRRAISWVALMVLAIVWTQLPRRGVIAIDMLTAVAAVLIFSGAAPQRIGLQLLKGIAVGTAVWVILIALHPGSATVTAVLGPVSAAPNDLAANAWAAYLRADPARHTESWLNIFTKIPTWFALAALLVASAYHRARQNTVDAIGSGLAGEVNNA